MSKSRGFILMVASIVLSSAAAADGYEPVGKGFAPPPVYSWSGVYVGVHGGGGWGDADWVVPALPPDVRPSPDLDGGALFGGHIGFQHQWGSFVAGAEVSYSGATDFDGISGCDAGDPDEFCGNEVNDLLLVNGRLGYAFGPTLLYATGGYARADIDMTIFDNGVLVATGEGEASGWNLGGGIAYLLAKNVILGVEYIHVDLDDENILLREVGGVLQQPIVVDSDFDLVRARLTIKLDREREAPVPLK